MTGLQKKLTDLVTIPRADMHGGICYIVRLPELQIPCNGDETENYIEKASNSLARCFSTYIHRYYPDTKLVGIYYIKDGFYAILLSEIIRHSFIPDQGRSVSSPRNPHPARDRPMQ